MKHIIQTEIAVAFLSFRCLASSNTLEIITTQNNSRVYRLDLSTIQTNGTTVSDVI